MSNNRPRSSERSPSSRREYEYYGESSNRRSSRSSSTRPPNGRDSASRPRNSTNSKNTRPSSRASNQSTRRSSTSKRRRRRSPFSLILLLACAAVFVIIFRACVSNNAKGNSDFTLVFSTQTLVVGETAIVEIEGLPENFNGSILWSSSEPEVVRINNGTLNAKKVGSATIAATIDGKTESATVQVIETVEGVESITLNQSSVTIFSGKTFQLEYTVTMENNEDPTGKPIIWTSSNPSVARVSNEGVVTARDVGTASITATIGNQSAGCIVSVQANPDSEPVESTEGTLPEEEPSETNPSESNQDSDATPSENGSNNTTTNNDNSNASNSNNSTSGNTPPPQNNSQTTANSMTISQSIAYLDVNGTLPLVATVSPSGTAVSWSSNNPSVASVSNTGLVTAKSPGKVTITAKAGGLSATCTIEVSAAPPEQEQPPEQTETVPGHEDIVPAE